MEMMKGSLPAPTPGRWLETRMRNKRDGNQCRSDAQQHGGPELECVKDCHSAPAVRRQPGVGLLQCLRASSSQKPAQQPAQQPSDQATDSYHELEAMGRHSILTTRPRRAGAMMFICQQTPDPDPADSRFCNLAHDMRESPCADGTVGDQLPVVKDAEHAIGCWEFP